MFYFGTNTKLQHTPLASLHFINTVGALLKNEPLPAFAQLWYCPPATSLMTVSGVCRENNIWLGAQNAHWEDSGAHTGELAPNVLKAAGAALVMLGHAERRTLYGESDAQVRAKLNAALRHQLLVMLCIGETALEKTAGHSTQRLREQLAIALADVSEPANILVLYEPVWSVGATGTAADPAAVAAAFDTIRAKLVQLFGENAKSMPLLYGGSVNAENCGQYAVLRECNGIGVGRNAWTAPEYVNVCRRALQARVDKVA